MNAYQITALVILFLLSCLFAQILYKKDGQHDYEATGYGLFILLWLVAIIIALVFFVKK